MDYIWFFFFCFFVFVTGYGYACQVHQDADFKVFASGIHNADAYFMVTLYNKVSFVNISYAILRSY